MGSSNHKLAGKLGAATFADMPPENTCSPDALTMNDNETLEEFIARAVDAQCDSFKSNVKGEEGNINISSLHYKAEVPTFDVTRKEYQVEEGSAEASQYLDQGLFIIGETIPDGTKFTPQILEEIVVIDNGTEIHELEKLYDGEESYNTFDNYAADYTQDILNSMPSDPAEIEAWEKYYQENGLLLEMNCRETDWTNHQYYQSGTKDSAYSGSNSSAGADKFVSDSISSGSAIKIGSAIKMKPGESLEEFFKRAISEQTHSFRKNVSQQEGDIRIQSIHFKTEMPDLTVKVVEHKATSNEEMVEFMDLGYQTSPLLGAGTGTGAGDVSSAEAGAIETKEELENYIQGLEEQLNSVGDDSQLANVDLQNHLQKQQQVLQMMSNISKVLHDTAQAIIRKIGG
jgi:hypothetical protein